MGETARPGRTGGQRRIGTLGPARPYEICVVVAADGPKPDGRQRPMSAHWGLRVLGARFAMDQNDSMPFVCAISRTQSSTP